MRQLYIILLLFSNFINAQDIKFYDPPSFNFLGTEIKWHHRITDPYKGNQLGGAVIRHVDQLSVKIDPLIINEKYIVVYDNLSFGLVIECYEMKTGEVNWRRFYNKTVNEDKRGTSCIYLDADGADHIVLTCFQSASVGGFSASTHSGGLINKRKLSISTGEQVAYLYNDVFSERIMSNISRPMHDIIGEDMLFYYHCGYPFDDTELSHLCTPAYISKSTLRRQNPLIVPDTIFFRHLDAAGFGPNYSIFGPLVEDENNFIYTARYFWKSRWHHEMWKVDDYGNLKWRKDITDLMTTPNDPRGLRYSDNISVVNDKIRILVSHSFQQNPIGHIGYVEFDFEGNLIKNREGLIIDGKKAGRMRTINLKGSDDILHCIRFQEDNNVYFYKEKPDGSFLKAGELINQNDDIYAFLPRFMTQSDNGDLYIQFSSSLDSIDVGQNFVVGGWQFACMIEADQLDIRVSTKDNIAIPFSISPNPTNDQVTITVPDAIKSGNIRITDQVGRTIVTRSIIDETTVVDISSLSVGLYFVLIVDQSGRRISQTQKLVKL